jgi:hypothetical protein
VDAFHQALHNVHFVPAAANGGRRCTYQAMLMSHSDTAWIDEINVTKPNVCELLPDV